MKHLKHSFLSLLLLAGAMTVFSQNRSSRQSVATDPDTLNTALFKALEWRNIGPFRGGRSNAVSGVVGHPQLYYAGYTGGGVWKTEDGGLSWTNISDGQFHTSSVGDIAVSESDPNVIYVGMGEHAVRGVMTTFGDGVYKSVNGGKNWTRMGLEKTRHISDVVIHPTDPDIVWVAAQGAVHGPTPERGIYKSVDGGKSWKQVLFVDENTGASSLSIDMTNPRILYAATWQHRRHPWKVVSGGAGSGLWKSTDGGDTWHKINKGLPQEMGKIGISVSRADPQRVFAIVESEKSKAGLYRSDDAGRSWKHMTSDQDLTSRSWYYMEVFADPGNAEVVYVLNAPAMRSIDGGKTFQRLRVGHGDTHDLWINPQNTQNMILGDDGGAEITYNGGASWSSLNNQPTAQFYRVNADKRFPYWVYGGQQDNSSVIIKSRTNSAGITDKDWHSGPGCESAFMAFDPEDPTLVYGGCYQGYIEVLDTRTMEAKDIMAYPAPNLAIMPKDMKYRFNWNAPIIASPHDPKVIYHAGNVLLRTTDGGLHWQAVSPDLTRNDTTKQLEGGGPFTNEGAGGENYNTIYYVIESPLEKGVIWTGSDCGLVHLTRDGGQNWSNVTPPNLPECMIHSIELSPHDRGTAYVSATRYKFNDYSAMVYKTTDYGATWTRIVDGIQADDFIRVIREDKKVKGLLYGGAERGFYVSYNGGAHWDRLQLNLPVVPINDLIIRDNDLVAATAGRAFWILDDLGPLQQSGGHFRNMDVRLFSPKPTYLYSGSSPRGRAAGQNPREGVVFDYFLAEEPDSTGVRLEIVDGRGQVIRSYSSLKDESFKSYPGGPPAPEVLPAAKGLNRFAWDFRTATLEDIPNVFVMGDYRGHRVAPGTYRARLTYKARTSETAFDLLADPRLEATAADWAAQQALLDRIDRNITEIHQAVNRMRKVKEQLKTYNEILDGREEARPLLLSGEALLKKIEDWEGALIEPRQKNFQDVINWPSKLNAEFFNLRGRVDAADPRVTQGARDRLQDLEDLWTANRRTMEQGLQQEIKAYNEAFRASNVPALITDFK